MLPFPATMPNPTQRGTYKPSGRVAWGTFLPLYAAILVGAMALAGGMYWLFSAGWYLMIIVPLVAALPLALALTTVVRVGKCRSPGLAWIAGIFAGALMYVGYFYVGMVAALGIQNAGRLDLFPQYVSWRAGNDVTHEEGRPATRQENPDPFMNWVWYALELGFVLYLCGMFARRRASRAFCERCGKWKQQDIALFPPGNGKTIAQWLAAGEIARLVGVPTFVPKGRSQRFTSVMVELCPPGRFPEPCPVYLGAKDISMGSSATAFQRFDGSPGKMRVRRVELSPEEAASLKPVFPRLSSAMSSPVPGPVGAPADQTDASDRSPPAAAAFEGSRLQRGRADRIGGGAARRSPATAHAGE
jgi:hypothetical protein